jgi:hypothetical protein
MVSWLALLHHGISGMSKPKTIPQSLIKFSAGTGTLVFQELLKLLNGNSGVISSPLHLGHLLPQILPGHRLWCYATKRAERFLTIEDFDVLHSAATKQVWLNLYLNRNDLERINISEARVLTGGGLGSKCRGRPSPAQAETRALIHQRTIKTPPESR